MHTNIFVASIKCRSTREQHSRSKEIENDFLKMNKATREMDLFFGINDMHENRKKKLHYIWSLHLFLNVLSLSILFSLLNCYYHIRDIVDDNSINFQ